MIFIKKHSRFPADSVPCPSRRNAETQRTQSSKKLVFSAFVSGLGVSALIFRWVFLRSGILLAVMAGGSMASAQSNNKVPSPTDYAAFSRFVADRNIYDPNRQPHFTSTRPTTRTRTRTSPSAPAFTFVGTMGYEKGLFAFFSGNNADLKKVLPVSETIAGYTVAEISQGRVTLTTTNQSEKLELKVGDVLRQENGKWALSRGGESPAASSSAMDTTETSGGENAAASAPAGPTAAGESNEILKRLMQKREQENK
jgi:hypothetical protein